MYPVDICFLGFGEISGCASDLEACFIASNHLIYQAIILRFQGRHVPVAIRVFFYLQNPPKFMAEKGTAVKRSASTTQVACQR